MKNQTVKFIALSIGAFGVVVLGNIAAQSMYARTGLTTDKKALTLSAIAGVGCAGLIAFGLSKQN